MEEQERCLVTWCRQTGPTGEETISSEMPLSKAIQEALTPWTAGVIVTRVEPDMPLQPCRRRLTRLLRAGEKVTVFQSHEEEWRRGGFASCRLEYISD